MSVNLKPSIAPFSPGNCFYSNKQMWVNHTGNSLNICSSVETYFKVSVSAISTAEI